MQKPERTRRADRNEADERLSASSSFRTAYSALVERSMTGSERDACMEKLWQQWGESDPAGMLKFLENKRVWPESCRAYSDLDFADRPDLSLDFALRYGSSDILRSCAAYGDPVTLARLLAALPAEQRGAEIVEAAKAVDRKLGRLGTGMENPSPAYRRGVAESLLEQGDIDGFLTAFGEIEDPRERKELARNFGEALAEEKPGGEVLARVLRLPEPYREEAAYDLMARADDTAMEFPEVRDAHKRWIESVAAAGFVEAAALGVDDLFDEAHAANRGEEMAGWIARFPPDGSWKPITEAAFRAWQSDDRKEMIQQIRALPEGPARETLATEAAAATIGGLAQPYDDEQQMIHDRLADLFTDPQARKQFEKQFAPWSERSEDSDPFTPVEAPFADDSDADPFANDD